MLTELQRPEQSKLESDSDYWMKTGLYWIWWNPTDKTHYLLTGNPVDGRQAVGVPLISPVPDLVPVSARSA